MRPEIKYNCSFNRKKIYLTESQAIRERSGCLCAALMVCGGLILLKGAPCVCVFCFVLNFIYIAPTKDVARFIPVFFAGVALNSCALGSSTSTRLVCLSLPLDFERAPAF